MPWHVDPDNSECSGYAVVKDSDGSIAGCHKTKKDAEAQLKALYASENDSNSGPTGADDRSEEADTDMNTSVPQSESAARLEHPLEITISEFEADEVEVDAEEAEIDAVTRTADAVERVSNVPPAGADLSSRIAKDHRNLPEEVSTRLSEAEMDVGIVDRAGRGLFELRFRPEIRSNDDGTLQFFGYATVYGHEYDVAGGAPYGFAETIARGAADRSVAQRDDVRFLINHEGVPLARTKSGTMVLESDERGLYVEIPSLDLSSPLVQTIASAMKRGDMDEMSFAFKVLNEDWNDDYTRRTITEVRLYDVSVVTFPANPAAIAMLRSDQEDFDAESDDPADHSDDADRSAVTSEGEETPVAGMGLALAQAELDLIDLDQ